MGADSIKAAETPAERRALVVEARAELCEIIEDIFYVASLFRAAGHSALAGAAGALGEGAADVLKRSGWTS